MKGKANVQIKWSEADLDQAIKDVKEKKHSLRKAAIVYNIPKSTLERHVNSEVSQPRKPNLATLFLPLIAASKMNFWSMQKKCNVCFLN